MTGSVTGSVAEPKDGEDMSSNHSKAARRWRKTYRFLGFEKGYNLPLFIIFAGAMVGFSLARLSYLNISGSAHSSYASSTTPSEWYWFRASHYRVGITLHLASVLPAGLLMVFQFVPAIRHHFLLFHRLNGYAIILLVLLGNTGALMIARRAFGGGLDTQSAVGVLVILTTISIAIAYINIKRLQVDQHRAWMLRAMFYLGTIITTRIIMILSALVISSIGSYTSTTFTCDELLFIYATANASDTTSVYNRFPQCNSTLLPATDIYVPIHANLSGGKEQTDAALGISFGMAIWMSILLHLVGVEIYLNLTPAETRRLRMISYVKQLEAGIPNPGSAGLTSDRFGDADVWRPEWGHGRGKEGLADGRDGS